MTVAFASKRKTVAALIGSFLALGLWIRLGPIPASLLNQGPPPSTTVVDRNGVPLYEARAEDGTRTIRLTANALPPILVSATIAAEDRRFWRHPGVDPVAMLRAVTRDVRELSLVEGGSTISQQVAKLLLNQESPRRRRGMSAKIQEAVLALRIEHRFTKPEILALYLNLAAYGNQIVGAERASRAYFGCTASMLTPAQAAFLAGLPQRPSEFNPYRSFEAAVSRQRVVLARMQRTAALSADQLHEALAEQLMLRRQSAPFAAPHFVEMVLAAVGDPRPQTIRTTLDAGLQADVRGIIESQRATLTEHGAANLAVVVLDNQSGEWLAWEGSGNYFDAAHGGAINGPLVPRQPGSALKPFTYALAFENGFDPSSVLPDIPSHFPTAEAGVLYSPRNYDGRYRGPMLARRALAGSENVPAVALASEIGVPNLLRLLLRAGFTTFDRNASYYGLGITLGNAEVRLDELVAAYSAFARQGDWIAPTYLANAPRTRHSLVSPRTAFWITDILSDEDAREYVFGRGGSLDFPFPVAAKTGTSQAYHDNWTIGFSRHVTVGVWVGNFDRKPLRNSSGVTGAGPLFHAVMLAADRRAARLDQSDDLDPFELPPSHADTRLQSIQVCALSGLAANSWCPARRHEWVAAEAKLLPCSWHHLTDEGLLTVWPAQYRQWARDHGLDSSAPAVRKPLEVVAAATSESRALRIASPPDGATYLIDPTLRREFQALPLRAVTATSGPLHWSVDERVLATGGADRPASWPLVSGRHVFRVRDDAGQTAQAEIVVR